MANRLSSKDLDANNVLNSLPQSGVADDSEVAVEAKSAYSRSRATSSHKTKRVYVPVFVPQRQKKKSKTFILFS
jgi:hypothetical protein